MSTEVFKDKSRAELVELVEQIGASVVGNSEILHQENQSASQVSASELSNTRN